MKLIPLLCPRCGANIQINEELESGSCMYCGTVFKVSDEIKRIKIEHSGSVKIDNSELLLNYVELSKIAYDADNLDEVMQYCLKILEIDPKHYSTWIMKAKIHTNNTSQGDTQVSESIAALNQGLSNAPVELQGEIINTLVEEISEGIVSALKHAGQICPSWDSTYQKSTSLSQKNNDLDRQYTISRKCINAWFQLLEMPGLTLDTYKKQIGKCKAIATNYRTMSLMKVGGKADVYVNSMKKIAAARYPEYQEVIDREVIGKNDIYVYIAIFFVPYFTFFYLLIKKPYDEKKNEALAGVCVIWTALLFIRNWMV